MSGLVFSAGILNQKAKKYDQVVSWNLGSWIRPHTNTSIQFDLKFFAPVNPGYYPVIFFLTGLNGFAANFFYTGFVQDIVTKSENIVIVLDGLEFSKLPDAEEKIFQETLDWTTNNIDGLFDMDATPASIRGKVFPDLKTKGTTLMGHSAAGHTLVSYLVNTCGLVKSLILLDPVDGYDPFGVVKQFITHPPTQLNFVVPTLLASTGLSSQPVIPLFPPCAPTNLSNTRFYDVLPGPTWVVHFPDYGHADVLTEFVRALKNLKLIQKIIQIKYYFKGSCVR
jgi:pimeloyl-ACP methyl ester carboxylesterase